MHPLHFHMYSRKGQTSSPSGDLLTENKMASSLLFCLCVCFLIQGIGVHAERKHHGVVVDRDGFHRVVELDGAAKEPLLQEGEASPVHGWFDSSSYASTG